MVEHQCFKNNSGARFQVISNFQVQYLFPKPPENLHGQHVRSDRLPDGRISSMSLAGPLDFLRCSVPNRAGWVPIGPQTLGWARYRGVDLPPIPCQPPKDDFLSLPAAFNPVITDRRSLEPFEGCCGDVPLFAAGSGISFAMASSMSLRRLYSLLSLEVELPDPLVAGEGIGDIALILALVPWTEILVRRVR